MEAQDHMLARRPGTDDAKSPPSPAYLPSSLLPIQQPSPPPPPAPPSLGFRAPPSLHFPDVAFTELAPIVPTGGSLSVSKASSSNTANSNGNKLPSFSTLTDSLPPSLNSPRSLPTSSASPPAQTEHRRTSPPRLTEWPSLNPYTTYYTPSHAQVADSPGKMDVEMSGTRAGSVSLDDPDVRMAAEALGDLRADFVSTPQQQPEPLLQLLTTSHPLLAKTIEGTTSAYNTSKNFSPRFKSGAEYVEGYLTPIGNTLGSVGRVTGVEGGVRWFLRGSRRQPPRSSDLESGDGSRNKRRRMMQPADDEVKTAASPEERASPTMAASAATTPTPAEFDPFAFRTKERRTSMSTVDTLPAYDDHRSPAYTEDAADERSGSVSSPRPQPNGSAAWQSRLILSTSGLSIAMSEESLRSLKYCLQWLRWANDHIAKVIGTLKATLEQYEQQQNANSDGTSLSTQVTVIIDPNAMAIDDEVAHREHGQVQDSAELGQRVAALKSDVLKTLRAVIDTVSKYAGGALPENARILVRRHLTSLPQRFKLASQAEPQATGSSGASPNEKEVREGAQRVLVLAQEGLDMMAQVSGVLDGTIVSAEEWCARLGKKKQEEREALGRQSIEPLTGVGIDGDVKMG